MNIVQLVAKVVGSSANNGTESTIPVLADSTGNSMTSLGTKISGESQTGAIAGQDHVRVTGEWKIALVNTNATGDVVVYGGPAVVRIIRVRNTTNAGAATTATAGIILVKDGTTVRDGAALGKAAGLTIYDGLDGTQFRTNITLNFASALDNPASDGKVEVLYRPLDPVVTW